MLASVSDDLAKKISNDLNRGESNTTESTVNDNNEGAQQGYNFDDFKKRLTMMKERYGIVKQDTTGEGSQLLETLRIKAKGMLTKQDSSEFNDMNSQPKSRIQNLRTK